MKFSAFLFVFVFSLYAFTSSVSAFGGSISPAKMIFQLNRGEEASYVIKYTNSADDNVDRQFTIQVSDFYYDRKGQRRFLNTNEIIDPTKSMQAFIASPELISIESGDVGSVPIKIKVPDNATYGDHYGVVYIEEASNDTSVVAVKARLASVLVVKVLGGEGLKHSGEAKAIKILERSRARNTVNFQHEFFNTGDEFFEVMSQIDIYDRSLDTDFPIKQLKQLYNTFPNSKNVINIPLGDLGDDFGEGEYEAVVKIYEYIEGKVPDLYFVNEAFSFHYNLPATALAEVPEVIEREIVVAPPIVAVVKELSLYIGGLLILIVLLLLVYKRKRS